MRYGSVKKRLFSLFAVMAAFGLGACTDFFSTSLAPWAARDPSALIPPVTAGNVRDMIALAENNPDMSLAILKGIRDAVNNASPAEQNTLRTAALDAAANATGLGTSMLNQAGNISSVMGDGDKAKGLIVDAINGMTHLPETNSLLKDILPDSANNSTAFDNFVNDPGTSAENLTMAAVVIMASEAKSAGSSEDFINNFNPNDPGLSASLSLSVKLATAASKKLEGTNDPLKDVLDGLKLIPSGGSNAPSIAKGLQ